MIGIGLTFQRYPWPDEKPDYHAEFQCKGILIILYYTLSELRGIKETHNCTPYAKWGVVSPVKFS